MTYDELLTSESYRSASPLAQRLARGKFLEHVIKPDPAYQALDDAAKSILENKVLFGESVGTPAPQAPTGKTLAQRMGFGSPGLVEGLTGSPLGRAVDIPLQVLNAPFALAGSVAEDMTGSPGVGLATEIGTGIAVPWAIVSKLRALRALRTAMAPAEAPKTLPPASFPPLMPPTAEHADAVTRLAAPGFEQFGNQAAATAERFYATIRDKPKLITDLRAADALHTDTGFGPATGTTSDLLERAQAITSGALTQPTTSREGVAATLSAAAKNVAGTTGEPASLMASAKYRSLIRAGKAGILGGTAGALAGGAVGAEAGTDEEAGGYGSALVGTAVGLGLGILGGRSLTRFVAGRVGTHPLDVAKVTEALRVPPSVRSSMLPTEVAEAAAAVAPDPLPISRVAIGIAQAKLAAERLTPRVMGFPMADVARGIPPLEGLVSQVNRAADDGRRIGGYFVKKVNAIYKPLRGNEPTIEAVNAALDTGDLTGIAGDAKLVSVYQQSRAWQHEVRDVLGIPPEEAISNYFYRMRDVLKAQTTTEIHMGERVIPVDGVIEIRPGDMYLPKPVADVMPKRYVPAFMKPRTLDEPATNLSLEPLIALAIGTGRHVALNGGRDPLTGKTLVGFLNEAKENMRLVPVELQQDVASWLNDFLGRAPSETRRLFSPENVARLKAAQFVRTIGLNILSPLQNTMQSLNTFALVRPSAWIGAWSDMLDPAKRLLAAQYGITADLTKADLSLLQHTPLDRGLQATVDYAGGFFRKSETGVRLQAFFAGLREAEAQGTVGEKAFDFARDLVSKTQFRFGREALPATFRPPGGMGELVQQFKNYTINQTLFLKNLIADDAKNVLRGGLPFARTAKYFGASIALFGSDATTLGLDKVFSEALTGNRDTLTAKGFFPSIGIYFANQIGLGVMPVEDLRSLLFFLPGPFLGMISNAASVASGLPALSGVRLSPEAPYGYNYEIGPNFAKPMTAEQFAAKATQLLPVGGIMANRLRRALLEQTTAPGGTVQAPANLPQAFGMEPLTGGLVRRTDTNSGVLSSPMKTLVGIQEPGAAALFERREEESNLVTAYNATLRNVASMVAAGHSADAMRTIEDFNKKYGVTVRLTPQAVRNAVIESQFTAEERLAYANKRTPRTLRTKIQELAGMQ